ncbi:MAG: trypsin-like peptidase domain-containing protein [Rhodobacter sp.]|nr:trypsin-like peptidase domain-containing protein [Rhodobacter sp.]
MKRGLFFLVLLAVWASDGRAEMASGLRTLMTGDDSRGWQAVGRLNMGTVSFCTGSLIAPDLVLTAAHCMFDKDTGQRIADGEIEFLADWRGGRAAAYRRVKRALVHPDFTFTSDNFAARVAHDVAILELDQPIRNSAIAPFPTDARPAAGAEVGVVSYAHDRADSPSLQEVCHVLARQGGSLVLSCEVDFGSSGAPIFVVEDGRARIVSLVSAKAEVRGQPVALGTSLTGPLADLMAIRDEGDGVFTRPAPKVRRLSLEQTQSATGAKFLRP